MKCHNGSDWTITAEVTKQQIMNVKNKIMQE